jgi:hypothetical protein
MEVFFIKMALRSIEERGLLNATSLVSMPVTA